MRASVPPQQVFDTPRTARPDAAKIVSSSPGLTAMEPTARAAKLLAPRGPFQECPPFFVT
jgi:hypothetical protein